MSALQKRACAGALAVVALMAMAPPSDPIGIYGIIDRVVVTPDTLHATGVQIWGTFAVSAQTPGDNYHAPVKGYLYYTLGSNERASRAEWNDLRHLAGTKTVVGFAAKWQRKTPGRVRCNSEPPANADEYPTENGMGVVRAGEARNTGLPIATKMLSANVPDAPCRAR